MSEIHDLAAPYLLGALDDVEQMTFEAHLDSCGDCRAEVARLDTGLIAMAIEDAEHPSGQVRDAVFAELDTNRVVEIGQRRSPGRYLVPSLAAAALLILAFAVGFGLGSGPIDDVLAADDAVITQFTVTPAYADADPETARVTFSESEGAAVVEFQGLSQPGADEVYQLWLIADGVATAAGLFAPDDSGSATFLLSGDATSGETVGVTYEPSGGSTVPTGDVLFAAEI